MADMVLPHIERLHKCSECRTPLICCLENGDPLRSIEALAKRRGSAVWKIAMDTPKNERNALDYLEVGLANGDWLYLVQCEKASIAVLREIALQLVQVNPDPKHHPRRGEFRLWLSVEHPIDINDNINSIFPAILTQNALYGWRDAASNRSRVMAKGRVDPEMVEEEDRKRVTRMEHGQDPDDHSDDEDAQKKVTGMWFHRTVDFYQADAENEVTRNVEDIFTAIQKGESAKVKEICGKNNVDLNLITHAELTPLMWAVLCDNIELVRVLLEHGADPNRRRESGHASTNGKLPIFMSLESPEMLQLLIDYGADIDARWEGYVLADHPDTAPDIKEYLHRLNQS